MYTYTAEGTYKRPNLPDLCRKNLAIFDIANVINAFFIFLLKFRFKKAEIIV